MNKKLLAVAVAGALSPLSITRADTANVQINLRLYPQYQWVNYSGATPSGSSTSTISPTPTGVDHASRQELNPNNSKITFHGDADVGGGLKGIWQIDNRVGLDTGNETWSNLDSYAGLSGGFGTVYLGRFNTVYKELGEQFNFLGVKTSNFVSNSNLLSKPGFSTSSAGSFHLRRNNAVHYETPVFGGMQYLVDYGPAENKSATRNTNLLSHGAKWESGPLYLALAHEIHKDAFGLSRDLSSGLSNRNDANARSKDQAVRATFGYKIGNTNIGFDIARIEYDEYGELPSGRIKDYKHNTGALGIEQRLGNVRVAVSHARATAGSCTRHGGADCSTNGLNGNVLNLGGAYDLAKRTFIFALYSKLTNGPSAVYSNVRCAPGIAKRWRVVRGRRVAAGEAAATPRRNAIVGERVAPKGRARPQGGRGRASAAETREPCAVTECARGTWSPVAHHEGRRTPGK